MVSPVVHQDRVPIDVVGLPEEARETTVSDVDVSEIVAREARDAARAAFRAMISGYARQTRNFYDSIPTRVDHTLPPAIKWLLSPTLVLAGQCHGLSRLALDTVIGIPDGLSALFSGHITMASLPKAAKGMVTATWDRLTQIPRHIMDGAIMSAGSNMGYVGGEAAMVVSGVGSLVEAGATTGRIVATAARLSAQRMETVGVAVLKKLPNPLEGLAPDLATPSGPALSGIPKPLQMAGRNSGKHRIPPAWLSGPLRVPAQSSRRISSPKNPVATVANPQTIWFSEFVLRMTGLDLALAPRLNQLLSNIPKLSMEGFGVSFGKMPVPAGMIRRGTIGRVHVYHDSTKGLLHIHVGA